MYDVIIIGSGVAGYSAAVYCARYKLKTLLVGKTFGGYLQNAHIVENYPSYSSISGQELMKRFLEHVKGYDVELVQGEVTEATKKVKGFVVKTTVKSFEAKTVIIASGTYVRKLGVPGEKEYENKGVSYCALCDGPLFKDKRVAVIGGSDSAAKEALLLAEYAGKVYIIYRREKIRAEPINYDRVVENKKIEIINNTNVVEVKGGKFVDKVVLDKPYKGSNELEVGGVFVEIGHPAEASLAKGLGVGLNEKGEIIVDKYSRTSVEGVYAAGDVTDRDFKQAITAAAEGVTAAYSAYTLLASKGG